MIDLEAIRNRHLRPEQMEHRTFFEGHIVIDLASLVEEIERLRAEAENGGAERARVLDYLSYRIEMSHYSDAIREFINARDEISDGVHHTINYDEVLP